MMWFFDWLILTHPSHKNAEPFHLRTSVVLFQAIIRSVHIAAGFLVKGLEPGNETFVGIYSANRPEWIMAEHACYQYSMVNVPLYDTLGPDACGYIINKTNIELVICDKNAKAEGGGG